MGAKHTHVHNVDTTQLESSIKELRGNLSGLTKEINQFKNDAKKHTETVKTFEKKVNSHVDEVKNTFEQIKNGFDSMNRDTTEKFAQLENSYNYLSDGIKMIGSNIDATNRLLIEYEQSNEREHRETLQCLSRLEYESEFNHQFVQLENSKRKLEYDICEYFRDKENFANNLIMYKEHCRLNQINCVQKNQINAMNENLNIVAKYLESKFNEKIPTITNYSSNNIEYLDEYECEESEKKVIQYEKNKVESNKLANACIQNFVKELDLNSEFGMKPLEKLHQDYLNLCEKTNQMYENANALKSILDFELELCEKKRNKVKNYSNLNLVYPLDKNLSSSDFALKLYNSGIRTIGQIRIENEDELLISNGYSYVPSHKYKYLILKFIEGIKALNLKLNVADENIEIFVGETYPQMETKTFGSVIKYLQNPESIYYTNNFVFKTNGDDVPTDVISSSNTDKKNCVGEPKKFCIRMQNAKIFNLFEKYSSYCEIHDIKFDYDKEDDYFALLYAYNKIETKTINSIIEFLYNPNSIYFLSDKLNLVKIIDFSYDLGLRFDIDNERIEIFKKLLYDEFKINSVEAASNTYSTVYNAIMVSPEQYILNHNKLKNSFESNENNLNHKYHYDKIIKLYMIYSHNHNHNHNENFNKKNIEKNLSIFFNKYLEMCEKFNLKLDWNLRVDEFNFIFLNLYYRLGTNSISSIITHIHKYNDVYYDFEKKTNECKSEFYNCLCNIIHYCTKNDFELMFEFDYAEVYAKYMFENIKPHSINLINQINSIGSIKSIKSINSINSINSIGSISSIKLINLIDSINSINSISSINSINLINSIYSIYSINSMINYICSDLCVFKIEKSFLDENFEEIMRILYRVYYENQYSKNNAKVAIKYNKIDINSDLKLISKLIFKICLKDFEIIDKFINSIKHYIISGDKDWFNTNSCFFIKLNYVNSTLLHRLIFFSNIATICKNSFESFGERECEFAKYYTECLTRTKIISSTTQQILNFINMIENNRPLVLNKNKKFVPLDGLNPNEIPNELVLRVEKYYEKINKKNKFMTNNNLPYSNDFIQVIIIKILKIIVCKISNNALSNNNNNIKIDDHDIGIHHTINLSQVESFNEYFVKENLNNLTKLFTFIRDLIIKEFEAFGMDISGFTVDIGIDISNGI